MSEHGWFSRRARVRILRLGFVPIAFVAVFGGRSWENESAKGFLIEALGYILLLTGTGLRLWATLYIGGRERSELVSDGPYSLCRNPLYVGTLLITAGASLCFGNFLMLALSLGLMAPVHWLVVSAEERRLAERFGADYQAYVQRTPRFLLRFRAYTCPEWVSVSSRSMWSAVSETVLIVLLPLVGRLVELLHDKGVLPVLWKVA